MTKQRLMKDGLGTDAIVRISSALNSIVAEFPVKQFQNDALNGIDGLKLTRIIHKCCRALTCFFVRNEPFAN